jgi:hypothetical protein
LARGGFGVAIVDYGGFTVGIGGYTDTALDSRVKD